MTRTENGETIHASVRRCFSRSIHPLNEFLMAIFGFSFQPISLSIHMLVTHAEEKRERARFQRGNKVELLDNWNLSNEFTRSANWRQQARKKFGLKSIVQSVGLNVTWAQGALFSLSSSRGRFFLPFPCLVDYTESLLSSYCIRR